MPLIFKDQFRTQRYLTWGAVAGAAVGVVGSALSSSGSKSNGGAGTQTGTKEPWAPVQPWILNNAVQGQNLQNSYTAQPFSDLQNQAYTNQNNQSAYMHGVVPSLLGQLSGQQVGFDRSNPNARPQAFNFGTANSAGQASVANQPAGGLLSLLSSSGGGNLNLNAQAPRAAQPASTAGDFVNQSDVLNGMNYTGLGGSGGLLGAGGYGSFKYGQEMPAPGTQAYRDMSAYFSNGGADPNNLYGRGQTPSAYGYGLGNSGNSVGGSPAGDGSGGGGPGVF